MGAGRDLLGGGLGNDVLGDDEGNNTFIFERGDGVDTFAGSGGSATNTLRFGAGIGPANVAVTRITDQTDILGLQLAIAGTADRIILNGFYSTWSPELETARSNSPLDRVEFADGTVWTIGQVMNRVFGGTAGDDVISGNGGIVYGGDGNDQLLGDLDNRNAPGNGRLLGGAGNDTLDGQRGNDVLEGGSGNDSLQGSEGDDLYLWGLGSGNDRLSDWGGTRDVLRIGAGIAPADVAVVRAGEDGFDILLTLPGGADSLTLPEAINWQVPRGFVAGQGIDRIEFADGTVLDGAQFFALRPIVGTAGDDRLDATLAGNDEPTGPRRIGGGGTHVERNEPSWARAFLPIPWTPITTKKKRHGMHTKMVEPWAGGRQMRDGVQPISA